MCSFCCCNNKTAHAILKALSTKSFSAHRITTNTCKSFNIKIYHKSLYCHLAPSKLQFISINCKILLHFNNKGAVTKIDLTRRRQLANLVNSWPLEEDSCLSLKSMVHEACTFTLSPTVGPKMSVYSALGMVAVLVEVTTSSYTKENRLKIQTNT